MSWLVAYLPTPREGPQNPRIIETKSVYDAISEYAQSFTFPAKFKVWKLEDTGTVFYRTPPTSEGIRRT